MRVETMPANAQPKRANYSVKDVETVMAGKDVRVRLFTLAPGEVIPWHSHSEIADEFFVLDGELTVETRRPHDFPKGSDKIGIRVFTAFDRAWPLVGLALLSATILCWLTLLGHLAIKLL